jgi:two-component system, chemotaxis family, protein-glutamate methylesterase/glutaminase
MVECDPKMVKRDIVAIGSSAGGLRALTAVIPELPKDLLASVFVVQHLDPRYESRMSEILARRSEIKVVEAHDGDEIQRGTVYFAPPDRHMLVGEGTIRLTTTQLVHFVRPSVDLLFESVAAAYGPRAVGVVLTGSGSDGALGIQAIRAEGGLTIVQNPEMAESTGMPRSAIATGAVDLILPIEEIAKAVIRMVAQGEDSA